MEGKEYVFKLVLYFYDIKNEYFWNNSGRIRMYIKL